MGDCQDNSPITPEDLLQALDHLWPGIMSEGERTWKAPGEIVKDLSGFSRQAIEKGIITSKTLVRGNFKGLKEKIVDGMITTLWSGYEMKTRDLKGSLEITKYPAADIQEAFSAAHKSAVDGEAVMRGNLNWILNRLGNPGMFRQDKRKKTKAKTTADICELETDWMEGGEED